MAIASSRSRCSRRRRGGAVLSLSALHGGTLGRLTPAPRGSPPAYRLLTRRRRGVNSPERPRDVHGLQRGRARPPPSPAGRRGDFPYGRKTRTALRGWLSRWAFGKLAKERGGKRAAVGSPPRCVPASLPGLWIIWRRSRKRE